MKARSLLILFLIAAAMGTYVYYGVQKPAEQKEADQEKGLLGFDISKLQRIRILPLNGPSLELVKEANHWKVSQPFQDVAATARVENLASAFEKVKSQRVLISKEDRANRKDLNIEQYGLQKPQVQIEVQLTDRPDPVKVSVGSQNPSSTATYIDFADQIHLASTELDYLKTQNPDDFREMRLVTVPSGDIEELTILRGSERMKLKKNEKNEWSLLEPAGLPIDREFVAGQIEKLSLLRANTFLEQPPSGATKPQVTMTLAFKKGVSDLRTNEKDPRPEGMEIQLYEVKGKSKSPDHGDQNTYYAVTDKNKKAEITRFHFDNFNRSAKEYVRKSFDDFALEEVESVEIKTGKALPIGIRRAEDGFRVKQGETEKEGQKVAIDELLGRVRNLRALHYLESSQRAPAPQPLTLDLHLKDKKSRIFGFDLQKEKSYLWFSDGGGTWMKYEVPKLALTSSFSELTKTETPSASPKPVGSPTKQ